MSNTKAKVIVLFVEGDTDFEFYKALISHMRNKNPISITCNIEIKNLKGIGNYKNDALRRFNDVKKKYPNSNIYSFLCYDTDVFDLSKKPPVNMNDVQKLLKKNGAKSVKCITANRSIEDWFLLDYEGVIRYLRLPVQTPKENGVGQEVLARLFRKANRVYIKGAKTENFIDNLNFDIIIKSICPSLTELCKCVGWNCNMICH